jgi:hypothetical protein
MQDLLASWVFLRAYETPQSEGLIGDRTPGVLPHRKK